MDNSTLPLSFMLIFPSTFLSYEDNDAPVRLALYKSSLYPFADDSMLRLITDKIIPNTLKHFFIAFLPPNVNVMWYNHLPLAYFKKFLLKETTVFSGDRFCK